MTAGQVRIACIQLCVQRGFFVDCGVARKLSSTRDKKKTEALACRNPKPADDSHFGD